MAKKKARLRIVVNTRRAHETFYDVRRLSHIAITRLLRYFVSLSLRLAAFQVIHQPRSRYDKQRCKERAQQTVDPQQRDVEADEADGNPEEPERTMYLGPQMSLQHHCKTV
jgi:hypothetical protein